MLPTRGALLLAAAGVLVLTGCTSSPNPGGQNPSTAPTQSGVSTIPIGATEWTGYHANQSRTGAVAAGPSLDPARTAWTASLGGAVYGQPVVADGRVIVATENNRVVALSPASGQVLWSASLGTPLTHVTSVAGCGDIDPLGITSTPVIDTATDTVYVVGEINDGGGVIHHELEGLSVATGAVVISENVDPPLPSDEHAVNLLQRASLALGNGRVYVSYGGNSGDCGRYHGWVVGVDETGPANEVSFEVASDGQGGAIWEAGGAPAIDSQGNVYVTTGNANPDPPAGGPDRKLYTESVVKLSPTLAPLASFKDIVAGGDEDLATGNPVLLPDGDVFAIGKTDIAYILTQQSLAKIAAIHGICGSDPDGGAAYDAATNVIFVPCRNGGIQEINLRTNTRGVKLSGANGAPILVGTDLWAAQWPQGSLTEFNATTGARMQTLSLGSATPHFVTPSNALGLIMIGTNTGVRAFEGLHYLRLAVSSGP